MNQETRTQDNYEDFMSELLRKVAIMKTDQMQLCLENYFEISTPEALSAMRSAQQHGFIITTGDGYLLNKGTYRYITEMNGISDQRYEGIRFDRTPQIDEITIYDNFKDKDLVDCMWIVADKMPEAYDFMVTSGLWKISFAAYDEENDKQYLYQLACFPKRLENANLGLMAACDSEHYLKEWLKDNRDCVRRIAIIENEEHAFKFVGKGFYSIVTIDEEDEFGYRILLLNDEPYDPE